MGSWEALLGGLMIAVQPENLFYCFIGCLAGTLVGVLPGIGPTATVALLLPTTFHLNPISAVIMLAGINYGAAYGGSTTSILVNVPGEASSVVTCLDGYQMARKGTSRPCAGDGGVRVFHRWDIKYRRGHVSCSHTCKDRCGIWSPRIFFSDAHVTDDCHLSGERLHGQCVDHGGIGTGSGHVRQ